MTLSASVAALRIPLVRFLLGSCVRAGEFGQITGLVTDGSGGAIPGTNVEAKMRLPRAQSQRRSY
jgi:hypothetical protein